jgi:hypothetical protein
LNLGWVGWAQEPTMSIRPRAPSSKLYVGKSAAVCGRLRAGMGWRSAGGNLPISPCQQAAGVIRQDVPAVGLDELSRPPTSNVAGDVPVNERNLFHPNSLPTRHSDRMVFSFIARHETAFYNHDPAVARLSLYAIDPSFGKAGAHWPRRLRNTETNFGLPRSLPAGREAPSERCDSPTIQRAW